MIELAKDAQKKIQEYEIEMESLTEEEIEAAWSEAKAWLWAQFDQGGYCG